MTDKQNNKVSNFQCPQCGMINIDCGKDGYKTAREIELEHALIEIEKIAQKGLNPICYKSNCSRYLQIE